MTGIVAGTRTAELTDRILELLRAGRGLSYFGEPVTQLEHALQTAAQADRAEAADALVIAGLLHDIGHLLHGMAENSADLGVDARHEEVGDRWLSAHFSPAVTGPIRLHVAAKRYLVRPSRRTPAPCPQPRKRALRCRADQ